LVFYISKRKRIGRGYFTTAPHDSSAALIYNLGIGRAG